MDRPRIKTLTMDEAEELVEHLRSRPDIWTYYNEVWARSIGTETEPEYALALVLRQNHYKNFIALTFKPYAWSLVQSDDYVEWLLEKYTAYGTRSRLIAVLEQHRVFVDKPEKVERLSRDLCEVRGGSFVRKYERS